MFHYINGAANDEWSMRLIEYVNRQFDPSVTWEDAAQLVSDWSGPFVVKGLQSAEDAKRAVDVGATAVWLSNHGVRQLDATAAPVDCIGAVRRAVGAETEIVVDSGIRRGTHVLKALALGADACAIRRPYLYGLAAGGQRGVERVLFAGAAIGTSHLVQSTRAGAMFGLGLLGIVVFANVIKYPAILSAVTNVAADIRAVSIGLIVAGVVTLHFGGYRLLDRITKLFVAVLTVATLLATILSLPRLEWEFGQVVLPLSDLQTLGFVIALMGFMPSALDLSVLQSLWAVAKQRSTSVRPSLAHALADFNVGYLGSAGLAICFLLMGAGVLHSAGEAPAAGAADFARQVVGLYTTNLGNWAGAVVGVSALFMMFSTLLTILDGFPRLLAAGIAVSCSDRAAVLPDIEKLPVQYACILVLAAGAALVLLFLMGSFQAFIDFVTVTAFVVSPITAALNHLVMFSARVPDAFRPSAIMRWWSVFGIVALSGLSLMFIYVRFV